MYCGRHVSERIANMASSKSKLIHPRVVFCRIRIIRYTHTSYVCSSLYGSMQQRPVLLKISTRGELIAWHRQTNQEAAFIGSLPSVCANLTGITSRETCLPVPTVLFTGPPPHTSALCHLNKSKGWRLRNFHGDVQMPNRWAYIHLRP